MQAVLMVAGKSTRTYPLTLTRPKPLLPIMNVPLIKHSLDQMVGIFDEVILIVGYRREMIEQVLGNEYRGIKLIYQEQKEQLGTGHAVLQAKPHITGRFAAMNGDDLFSRTDFEQLIKYDYAALALTVNDPSQYGVFEVDSQQRALNLVEKPFKFIGNLANIGCYIFEPEIFDILENTPYSERGEIEITSAIQTMSKRKAFYVLPVKGFWLPTGFAWDILKHQEFFMQDIKESVVQGKVEKNVTLKDPVHIGKGTVIKAGAYIEGPVIIGDHCEIGPNCYLRGSTSIGNHCKIGAAVEIKNSIIMEKTTISHQSYVGDSVIGSGCNLGAGTIIANRRFDGKPVLSKIKDKLVSSGREKLGAILADNVQTGIHTSIYPGRKIWPGMTIAPGELVRKDIMPEIAQWT